MSSSFICRVCGFEDEDPPWGLDGRTPTFDSCVCCGIEHGYQDVLPAGAARARAMWLGAGAVWREPNHMPENWSLAEQLKQIPEGWRDVDVGESAEG